MSGGAADRVRGSQSIWVDMWHERVRGKKELRLRDCSKYEIEAWALHKEVWRGFVFFFVWPTATSSHSHEEKRHLMHLQYMSGSCWCVCKCVSVCVENGLDFPHSRVENPLLSGWAHAAAQPSDPQTQTVSYRLWMILGSAKPYLPDIHSVLPYCEKVALLCHTTVWYFHPNSPQPVHLYLHCSPSKMPISKLLLR